MSSNLLFARHSRGTTIVEVGPSLFVLTLLCLFPFMNLASLSAIFMMTSLLNDEQLREAALIPRAAAENSAGVVRSEIPSKWRQSGFGCFSGVIGGINTDVSYKRGIEDDFGVQQQLVVVVTRVTASSILNVPFPMVIPGLNAPVQITVATQRPVEDPVNATE
jgi:hypothetical protein